MTEVVTRKILPCRHCGYDYRGRGIFYDHGFAEYNLGRHEAVCVERRAQRIERLARRYARVVVA